MGSHDIWVKQHTGGKKPLRKQHDLGPLHHIEMSQAELIFLNPGDTVGTKKLLARFIPPSTETKKS